MYGGRPGYGGQLPYGGLGERSNAVYNLAGVAPDGYGPYLGDFFDDVSRLAGKVGAVAGKISEVTTGKATVTTVPKGYSTLTLPYGDSAYSQAIPLWAIGLGAAGLLYLAFRKR